ncbi:MAG: PhnD/SsuA/transferrin family substrate-binding protein [Hyalangium sp.]|uniref:sensor histidine kinase n=1 Tax=Hyalangium sp. TaxID=2028555 RepID=UPI003899A78E
MALPSPPIRFLTYPLLGVVKEHVRAEFFARVLSQRVGRPVIMEQARTYESVEHEVASGRVDMALATAEQCNLFESQSRAVLRAVRAGRCYYHSAFICRAEEPLSLNTLHGRRAAWVAPLSTAGYLLPKRYLEALGLSPSELFAEQRFYGTYRQALLAVLSGEADVTAHFTTHKEEYMVRALLAERVGPDERRLRPFAFSEPTLADGIIITHRMPPPEAAAVVKAITAMSYDEDGGLKPVLAPFDIQGFALVQGAAVQAPAPRAAVNSDYLTLDVDTQERCQHVWSSTGTIFGRDVRNSQGLSLRELLPPEASIPLESLVRSARVNNVSGRIHFRMEAGGQPRLFAAEATLRPSGPGEEPPPLGLLVRDITELDTLEQELYRLASFPLLHPDPMLELRRDGQLRYANPPAHSRFPDLLELGTQHPLVKAAMMHARRNSPSDGPELVQLAGRFWEVVATPLQDNESLRVFAKDVTARKHMEVSLMHADRMASLGTLASRVGHEMNNPLAFLMANLSFAREEIGQLQEALRGGREGVQAVAVDEVIDALSEALEGADRLKVIVQDLRQLTREAPSHRARVDVVNVLEDSLKLIRNELRHRARLEKDFQPIPPVEADEAGLGHVFLNLLLNAVQAMSEQDAARNVLRVSTRVTSAGEVIIEVQDTGAGMAPEVLSRLFEPFFTTRASSTGLGLSVSHAIVTSLGGTLRAESHPGVGTLFTVVLPAAGSPVTTNPPQPEHGLAS